MLLRVGWYKLPGWCNRLLDFIFLLNLGIYLHDYWIEMCDDQTEHLEALVHNQQLICVLSLFFYSLSIISMFWAVCVTGEPCLQYPAVNSVFMWHFWNTQNQWASPGLNRIWQLKTHQQLCRVSLLLRSDSTLKSTDHHFYWHVKPKREQGILSHSTVKSCVVSEPSGWLQCATVYHL